MWNIKQFSKPKLKNITLIEGLPGVGNVGKIAVDFLIDSLKAKKLYEFSSHKLPHCVFVNEDNLVELPAIEIFYKKIKNRSLLLLSGDTQPIDEVSCYEFCNNVLNLVEKTKGSEIITLGGLPLDRTPKTPKIFCGGTDKKIIKKYKTTNLNYPGPIIGVSGLLTGLARKRKLSAISLLAETYAHPTYLGIRSAKELLKVINKKLNLNLNLNKLDSEIKSIEKDFKSTRKLPKISKLTQIQKDTNYIG